jgi:TFIIF-interacting CTD phosphatase-like protein
MQKIYYILSNYPSYSSPEIINMFKKIKTQTYDEINDFFLENILREKGLKYSIIATTFLRSGEVLANKPAPYLTYRSPKNYTLVLDIDETLFNFRINEENEEQGVLKIRPGVFQFIDEIKEYYEIILFSEAERSYIDLLTEAIGENRYLYDCVLCRDYMSIVGKNFVKDLNKIGRTLDRVIIVDNMPQNFSLHKENSIYIKSFWGVENDDKALLDLIPILISIAQSGNDVRKELVKYKEKIITKISSNIYKHSNL